MSQDSLRGLFSDRKKLIESLVRIENKSRQLVPFHLNPIQRDMALMSGARDVYVKPAQVGGTSYIMCDFLLDCLTVPGTTSVIISYDEFITGRLLRKAQSFYDNLIKRIPTLPKLYHKSTFEKTFIFENKQGVKRGESSFYIASAKSFAAPRGEPMHNLLLDELGFWPKDSIEDIFAGAVNRVPLLPGTKIRALSTPNGEDNDFYELYMAAKEGRTVGKSVFKAHFYTWWQMPEYRLSADSEFCLPGDETSILTELTPDEQLLLEHFIQLGMDMVEVHDRLRWRRYKRAEASSIRRSGETQLLFSQEFPEDDVTCFQSTGDQWYNSEDINRLAKDCYPPATTHLDTDIWSPPEEELTYLVAIDPGLGKKSESVASVWNFTEEHYRHVATLSGLYAGKEMADKCKPLAKWYNEAMIANEDSLDITSHLTDYPNLYYRTDVVTGKVSAQIGWQTNPATKVYMCNELKRALPRIESHDNRFVSQLRNIREGKSRGRIIPIAVGADDYHDSAAIAIVCRGAVPVGRGFVGSKGWSDSWGR